MPESEVINAHDLGMSSNETRHQSPPDNHGSSSIPLPAMYAQHLELRQDGTSEDHYLSCPQTEPRSKSAESQCASAVFPTHKMSASVPDIVAPMSDHAGAQLKTGCYSIEEQLQQGIHLQQQGIQGATLSQPRNVAATLTVTGSSGNGDGPPLQESTLPGMSVSEDCFEPYQRMDHNSGTADTFMFELRDGLHGMNGESRTDTLT